jgi:hypothetical protein
MVACAVADESKALKYRRAVEIGNVPKRVGSSNVCIPITEKLRISSIQDVRYPISTSLYYKREKKILDDGTDGVELFWLQL